MGIFRKTQITASVAIYSKWCIQCETPYSYALVQSWAQRHSLDVQVIRTAYRPADHKEATRLWALANGYSLDNEVAISMAKNYPTFIVHKGKVTRLKEFVKMVKSESSEDKMVRGGKAKNDVQRLPKAEKSAGKNSVVSAVHPASHKTKKKQEKK